MAGTTDSRPKTALAGTAADPGPDAVDSSAFRGAVWTDHQAIVKMTEKRWFSDIRLSPHILNDEEDVDWAPRANRQELAREQSIWLDCG